MKFYQNLKISSKLIYGFLIIALIAGAIGVVGIFNINRSKQMDQDLYKRMTAPLGEMITITESFQRMHVRVMNLILVYTGDNMATYEQDMAVLKTDFSTNLNSFKSTLITEEGMKLAAEVETDFVAYQAVTQEIIDELKSMQTISARDLANGPATELKTQIENDIRRMKDIKIDAAQAAIAQNNANAEASTSTMLILMIGGMALAIALGFFISRSISKPVGQALTMIQEMSQGHLSTRLNFKGKDEIGLMGGAMDSFADDLKYKLVGNMNRIADGDVSMELSAIDERDEITPAMITMIKTLRLMVNDVNMLAEAALAGRLSTRADASKHAGSFQKIVEGINNTLDAVIEPVQEASVVLKEMAEGNLKLRVVGQYEGDNALIKNALNETLDEVSAYILEISETLTQMANSNMAVEITRNYKGDFGQIKNSLNLIIDAFNQVLSEISQAAENVAAGSRQVSEGSQFLSQGTTEQATAIEQLTASITEITEQTVQNADNAVIANDLALKAKSNAVCGNNQMRDMLMAMDEINLSSSNISKIIKVIDDIAFQTNILALNAAVEAARAGQHGKGFAVVAEEVRNLAARSAKAASETTALIEGSIEKAGNGSKLAKETAQALNLIVGDISKAADLVGSIATASNKQSAGISQINQGITQVSQVIQANSGTAEESAAASEELSSQAQLLKDQVSRFILKSSGIRVNGQNSQVIINADSVNRHNRLSLVKSQGLLNDLEFGKY